MQEQHIYLIASRFIFEHSLRAEKQKYLSMLSLSRLSQDITQVRIRMLRFWGFGIMTMAVILEAVSRAIKWQYHFLVQRKNLRRPFINLCHEMRIEIIR